MSQAECKYGRFLLDKAGTYQITDTDALINWEYIYQNRDILLRVDKYGPVNSQAVPPKDIILFKRADSDKFSKWQVWIQCPGAGVEKVSNFSFPRYRKPLNGRITFSPEKAVYHYDYGAFSVDTEIMLPFKGSGIVMSVTVNNTSGKKLDFGITPALYPYVNKSVIPPWDKSEWYLKTSVGKNKEYTEFMTRLNTVTGDARNRRLVLFQADGHPSADVRMEDFVGNGDFNSPDAINGGELYFASEQLGGAGEFSEEAVMQGYPPVYACKYNVEIKAGESKTFSQVLSMQSVSNCGEYVAAEAERFAKLLDKTCRDKETAKHAEFFTALFSKRTIRTGDVMLDNYINTWLPLQVYWVASLDRGWATGLRGVRDAANDFMGVLHYDAPLAREVILDLFSCQRTDGWTPRQVSVESRKGAHDLRPYSDNCAFLFELLYEYICVSGDLGLLDEKLPWLDSDREDTVYIHMLRAIDHYIDPKNLGEHGLCKIYEGDWLDALNRAGMEGRGESVMVSGQTVINLGYTVEILSAYPAADKKLIPKYEQAAQKLRENLVRHALNKKGFFNGAFTDGGFWIFSDGDPDGETRVYGNPNYYAILSGAPNKEQTEKIWENIETLKSESGYKLFTPAFGKKPLKYVGRIASGDMPDGLWENGTVYNHAQCFMMRALAYCGKGDRMKEVLYYILPYDQANHPVDATKNAPYALVNCYQILPHNRNRGGLSFLTGTTSMLVRLIYNWMLGIKPGMNALNIAPCLEKGKINKTVTLTLRGKTLTVNYSGENKTGSFEIFLNGKKTAQEIRYDKLTEKNTINVTYI